MEKDCGKLILIATPIGNLSDLSYRAIENLKSAGFIAAEDTRVTIKLLNHFGIKKELISYHEHNKKEKGNIICSRILNGEDCALVTDAGMPGISDPGEDLVKLCYEKNIKVTIIPGACSSVCALAISGLSTKKFCFEGFLSTNKKQRLEHLNSLIKEEKTLIFNSSPHKLTLDLKDLYKTFGNRKISIVKELTKIHEEVIKTSLEESINLFKNNSLKGEFILVLEGYKKNKNSLNISHAVSLAKVYIKNGKSINEASKLASKDTGFKKSDIYKILLNN